MATMVYALDGGGPKDSQNTLYSFFTKCNNDVFWQIDADMVNEYVITIWSSDYVTSLARFNIYLSFSEIFVLIMPTWT